ncbi:MAG: hypothetical protein IKY66_03215 [Bacteroidales bacterium]|nr:hypothetical protein [Bacteroidales bacterium]
MKKLILIISMALASSLAFAQENTDKTLYIVDGAVSQKSFVDVLPKDLINNMEVIKGVESVVVITTKAKAAADTPVISIRPTNTDESTNNTEYQSVATITYRTTTPPVDAVKADPLCILKSPDGTLSKGELSSISPDSIKSIHVFKNDKVEPYKTFGDTSNGVILIELK